MPLNRAQIIDAAYIMLRDHGLAGVSMRRLAQDLGVQPGALYYHVANKQELLAAVADRILTDAANMSSTNDPAQAVHAIRAALLGVRDSAEVISFVHAYHPDALTPFRTLEQLFAAHLPAPTARGAARTLISYVLGFIAEEQNHAELVRAKLIDDQSASEYTLEAFQFGVDTIVHGLRIRAIRDASPEQSTKPPSCS